MDMFAVGCVKCRCVVANLDCRETPNRWLFWEPRSAIVPQSTSWSQAQGIHGANDPEPGVAVFTYMDKNNLKHPETYEIVEVIVENAGATYQVGSL